MKGFKVLFFALPVLVIFSALGFSALVDRIELAQVEFPGIFMDDKNNTYIALGDGMSWIEVDKNHLFLARDEKLSNSAHNYFYFYSYPEMFTNDFIVIFKGFSNAFNARLDEKNFNSVKRMPASKVLLETGRSLKESVLVLSVPSFLSYNAGSCFFFTNIQDVRKPDVLKRVVAVTSKLGNRYYIDEESGHYYLIRLP